MALRFPASWRFTPPGNGRHINSAIPPDAVWAFMAILDRVPATNNRWDVLERFKSAFGASSRSSSESWAETDLANAMEKGACNAPLFLESFCGGLESVGEGHQDWFAASIAFVNALLAKHNIGYEVSPPDLNLRELGGVSVPVAISAPTIAQTSRATIEASLFRSEQLLVEGRAREAVQEILWLLESVATAFRGFEAKSGRVEGKYFNQIVRELRNKHSDTTLERALEWAASMHGYLSSPTGGGVRHGIDLEAGDPLGLNEARLFCNLTRSYIHYLLGELRPLV